MSSMTATDERQALSALAAQNGWHRRDHDRADYYAKDATRIQVLWQGTSAISGGSLYHDDVLTTYTRELGTVQGWLKR